MKNDISIDVLNKTLTLNTFVEKTNAAFKKANKARRRVLIAKDALIRTKLNNLRLNKGSFVGTDNISKESTFADLQFKNFINDNNNTCIVCAKGAMFCSIVGRDNKLTYRESFQNAWSNDFDNTPHETLLKYFSAEQLDLIEIAFEGRSYLYAVTDLDLIYRAKKIYETYESHTDTFIAICNNIIKNKGEFKP